MKTRKIKVVMLSVLRGWDRTVFSSDVKARQLTKKHSGAVVAGCYSSKTIVKKEYQEWRIRVIWQRKECANLLAIVLHGLVLSALRKLVTSLEKELRDFGIPLWVENGRSTVFEGLCWNNSTTGQFIATKRTRTYNRDFQNRPGVIDFEAI